MGSHPILNDGGAGPAAPSLGLDTQKFTLVGIVIVAVVIWIAAQNATGDERDMMNAFLGVLLLSMVLMNWEKISPIFFKGGN